MLSEKMTINPWVWTLKQTRNGLLGKTCLADGNMLQSIPDHDHIEAILRGVASGRPFGHSAGVQIPVLQNLVFLSKKIGGCSKGARGDILTQENLGTMKNMLNMMITPILGQIDCKEALQNHPTILVKGCDMVRGFQK